MALHDDRSSSCRWCRSASSISILNGIVGDAAFSAPFALAARHLQDRRPPAEIRRRRWSCTITFLSIIFGELVPKRIGLQYPETVARLVARPMEWLSLIARPFVRLLTWCTDVTLRLFGIRGGPDRSVTEEEIAASLEEGLDAGVIEAQEHQMVRNVFRSTTGRWAR
jgi:putative hemolysin